MRYRYTTLQSTKTLGESGTEIIDLTLSDIVTAIRVMLIATSASTAWSNHPAANVTKVELVDGSDVLFSLTGKCAEAIDFLQRPRPRPSMIEYRNGRGCACVFDINFGRYLGDRELGFDPKKFKNPQLKITWDIDVCETSASAGTYDVKALVFDEVQPAPMGFLMSKELKAYTPAADTWEYTDLPLDYPMRTLGIQAQVGGSNLATSLADVKLSEDNDKRIPFNDTANDLARFIASQWPAYVEHVRIMLTTSLAAYYVTPGYNAVLGGASLVASSGLQAQVAQGGKVNAQSEVAGQGQFVVTGSLPHQVLALPFGRRDIIEEWYDVTKVGSLRLSLKGGSAATGTFRIITEQLRRY
uniref:Uncharacterized protein n=1 Tax=viral metagenome TaxID=1070528 RepID=A0A6M3Y173_9ZZZZ